MGGGGDYAARVSVCDSARMRAECGFTVLRSGQWRWPSRTLSKLEARMCIVFNLDPETHDVFTLLSS